MKQYFWNSTSIKPKVHQTKSTSEAVLPSNQKQWLLLDFLQKRFSIFCRDVFKTLSDTCDGFFWKNSERLKPLFVWQGPKYASEFIFQNVSCWDWLSETEKKVTPQISLGRTITHSSIICLDLELLLKVKPKNAFKRPFRKVHRFESEVNFNNYLMKNKH